MANQAYKDRHRVIPAVYLVLRDGDKVLLLQRANTGYQDGNYSLVAGHLDGEEAATAAIVREAKEEAGITIDPADVTFVHLTHRLNLTEPGQERMDLYFAADKWSGDITNMEPNKCSDLSWFTITDLPDNIIPLNKYVLTDIANGVAYSEYDVEPK